MTTQIDTTKMIDFANQLEGEEQEFYISTMESVEKDLLSIAFNPDDNITIEKILPHISKNEIDHLNLLTLETFMTSEFSHPKTGAAWNTMDVFLQRCGKALTQYEKKYFESLRTAKLSVYEVIEVDEGHSLTLRDLLANDNAKFLVKEPELLSSFPRWGIFATNLISFEGEIRMQSAILQFKRHQLESTLESLKGIDQFMAHGLSSLDLASQQAVIKKTTTNLIAGVWLSGCLPDQNSKNYVNRDGEVIELCKYRFPLTASKEKIAAALNEIPEFQTGQKDKWIWLIPLEGAQIPKEQITSNDQNTFVQLFAGMTLEADELIAETTSKQRAIQIEFFLKEKLEGLVGEPTLEVQDAEALISQQKIYQQNNQDLPLEQIKEMYQAIDGYYKVWMNRKTPTLSNLCPRDAVKIPEGRKKVISLLKDLDISFNVPFRKQKAKLHDSSWVFGDLGIKELEL